MSHGSVLDPATTSLLGAGDDAKAHTERWHVSDPSPRDQKFPPISVPKHLRLNPCPRASRLLETECLGNQSLEESLLCDTSSGQSLHGVGV